MNREELIAFMKRVTPILHEPIATKVAEEWADKFVEEFKKPQGEPSDAQVSKLANDAHHRMVDEAEADGGWYGFSHSRDAWEDGYATGYRARAAGVAS